MSRSPPKRGRPARKKKKTILLRESTFRLWNQRKNTLGFKGNTNSEYEFLLHSYGVDDKRLHGDSVGNMSRAMTDGTEAKRKRAAEKQ